MFWIRHGLWIKARDGETPAVRKRAQVLIPSLWTSNWTSKFESLRSERSLTQCGVMQGLLERTIRAERDTRDKKGEEGIMDLISPSPGDELFRTASVIINEKKKGTIYPLYYCQESVSFLDMTMYLQREKNLKMKCTKYSRCKKKIFLKETEKKRESKREKTVAEKDNKKTKK